MGATNGSLIVREATFFLYESGKAPTYMGDLPPEGKRTLTGALTLAVSVDVGQAYRENLSKT